MALILQSVRMLTRNPDVRVSALELGLELISPIIIFLRQISAFIHFLESLNPKDNQALEVSLPESPLDEKLRLPQM